MTDLTKQWKKGELINGKKYYITFFDSEPFEATFRAAETIFPFWKFETNGRQYCNENGYDCVKVLAPVPSYEEWQLMQDDNKRLKHDVGNLGYKIKNQRHEIDNRLKEIAKLKELLKECKIYVENFIEGSTLINEHHISYILLQRIKKVLK